MKPRVHDVDGDEHNRRLLSEGRLTPAMFRAALHAIPPGERDGWVDRLFGLGELPADGPELPTGCVPYLPCPVNTVLRAIELAQLGPTDVFVDVGSGVGRAAALAHFSTGARAIGIEIQSALVSAAREVAARLNASGLSVVQGDAVRVTRELASGSVFFFYCPFSGERLERVLDDLEAIARTRPIRICAVHVTLPPRPWFAELGSDVDVTVYRSVC